MLSGLKHLLPKPGRFIKSFTRPRAPKANALMDSHKISAQQTKAIRQSIQPDTFNGRAARSTQFDPYLAEAIKRSKISYREELRLNSDTAKAIKRSKISYREELRLNSDTAKAIKRSKISYREEMRLNSDTAKAINQSKISYRKELSKRGPSQIQKTALARKNAQPLKTETPHPKVIQAATQTLKTSDLFGSNLKSIHFQQGNTNTCYLLSALDNIFQHPKGKKILDLIKIKEVENGFSVKFPGQPHSISVSYDELGAYVKSETPGVSILEQAYLKIPRVPSASTFDTTNNALVRMFGANRVRLPSFEETTLAASAQMQPLVDEFADIWTATKRLLKTGESPRIGEHYYSLRLNPNLDEIQVVNPHATNRLIETLNQAQLEEAFWPELNQIRLSD
jgi:hypothetical protein